MYLLRKQGLFYLAALMTLLLSFGIVNAGVEAIYNDGVMFKLNQNSAFVPGTKEDPAEELATLDAGLKFDVDPVQTLGGVAITISFNPDYLNLVAARPSDAWAGIGPNDYSLDTVMVDELLVVQLLISYTSTIATSTDWTTVAHFDFEPLCQPETQVNDVPVIHGQAYTYVRLNNNDIYYVDEYGEVLAGSVGVSDYQGDFWIADVDSLKEYAGVLGQVIDVPVIVQTNYKLGHVVVYFNYNAAKLELLGVTSTNGYFWPTIASEHGTNLGKCVLAKLDAGTQTEFPDPTQVAELWFKVLGTWEGDTATISISNHEPPYMIVGYSACEALDFAGQQYHRGTVAIDNYVAAYSTVFTDGATFSQTDGEATMQIKLTNNFPAGKGNNSIIANLKLDTNLQAEVVDPGADFGMHVYPTATGQEVSLRLETSTFFDNASAPQDMVAITILPKSGFVKPTVFENRFYPILYRTPYDNEAESYARVKDTCARVTTTNTAGTLTWDSPQIEYLMGEYQCPAVNAGAGLLTQNYYMRSSFTLHDFRVKIKVTGVHNIYDVNPEPGVEVVDFDDSTFKWVVLATDAEWTDQTATDDRTKFASITYSYWGNTLMLEMDQPGAGHWVTKTSQVSFVCAADSGYYMKDTDNNDQHEVAIGGQIRNRWWVDDPVYDTTRPEFPNRLLTGPDGLPVEYALLQNYPNPFNPTTEFWYALPEGAYVEISVYNIIGQKVATLVEGWREAGAYLDRWDADNFASGVYFYRLRTDNFVQSKKMILVK